MHRVLWFLGVIRWSSVPGLLAVGALHTRHFNAQRPSGSECYSRLYRDRRAGVPFIRHCTQHCRAYLTLRQVLYGFVIVGIFLLIR